jgi:hypothetical protein
MNETGNGGCFIKGGIPWNKGTTKHTNSRLKGISNKYKQYIAPFIRNCPDCQESITYSTVYYFVNAIDNDRKCNKCANNGKGWQTGLYGYERTPEIRKKCRISAIKYINNQIGQIQPRYNISSIPIIEQKAKELGITDLQHAENGGEFYIKELGYFVDGYSKEKNIVIEYDENHHYTLTGKLKKRDKQRQQEIENFLSCEFIRINGNI